MPGSQAHPGAPGWEKGGCAPRWILSTVGKWRRMDSGQPKPNHDSDIILLHPFQPLPQAYSHSRTLAWKIPRTEEPGRLQSMGSWRVYYLFSRGSSQPRNWTGVSFIVGGFFTSFHLLSTYLPGICKSLCSLTHVILADPIRDMLLIFPIFTDEETKDRGVRVKFPSYLYILSLSCCVGYIHIKPPLMFHGMLANKKYKEQNKYF